MLEKYLNYGECKNCHKKAGRVFGADICGKCFEESLKALEKMEQEK